MSPTKTHATRVPQSHMSTLPDHDHNGHHPTQLAPIQHHTTIHENDSYTLENYRPITLATVLYKLWASCIAILTMDYIEANKTISPVQEGFRPSISCFRAITHLSLCIENAHTHNKDSLIAYPDFNQAFSRQTTCNSNAPSVSYASPKTSSL
jgi:hypothetical protein